MYLTLVTRVIFAASNLEVSAEKIDGIDIKPYSKSYIGQESRNNILSIHNDVKEWNEIKGEMSWGHSKYPVWIKVEINASSPRRIVFDHLYIHTDRVDVYHVVADEVISHEFGGDRVIFKKSISFSRSLSFLVKLQPGKNFVYFKIQSQGFVSGRFNIWDEKSYADFTVLEHIYLSLQIGGLTITLLYNLCLLLSLRRKEYLLYVTYLSFFIGVQCILTGFSLHYLPDGDFKIWCSNEGFHLVVLLAVLFALRFTIAFLNLKEQSRTQHLMLHYYSIFIFGCVFVIPFISYRISSIVVLLLICGSSVLMMTAGIISTIRRYRPAYFYTSAWSFLLLGTIVTAMKSLELLPVSMFTNWSLITGATLEAMLFSLALAERFNDFQRRAAWQKEKYIEELLQKEKSKKHLYDQLQKLVYPHQLNMIRSGKPLEATMPCQIAKAFVLFFDIVNSSKIEHSRKKQFFRAIFSRCFEKMMENYDPQELIASAYRIKELGDGFLCSVGFPFQAPLGKNPADLALELAFAFVKSFESLKKEYGIQNHELCSIAISYGDVEGFYPVSGVREYDLFGQGIVWADRYEALRKQFLQKPFPGNILVVQQQAYDKLSSKFKENLEEFRLPPGTAIRDHAQARKFYYAFIPTTNLFTIHSAS